MHVGYVLQHKILSFNSRKGHIQGIQERAMAIHFWLLPEKWHSFKDGDISFLHLAIWPYEGFAGKVRGLQEEKRGNPFQLLAHYANLQKHVANGWHTHPYLSSRKHSKKNSSLLTTWNFTCLIWTNAMSCATR